jgi:ATP-binding cassette, subfamily G (WHITE), member 2, SNQ2
LHFSILNFFFFLFFCLKLTYCKTGGYTRQVYKKGKAPKQNDANAVSMQKDENLDLSIALGESTLNTTFLWQDMKYTVPVKGGKRLLLDNVDGWIKPGQMTAL